MVSLLHALYGSAPHHGTVRQAAGAGADAALATARGDCRSSTESQENLMAYSSILGADDAPQQPSGRTADLLGPSDNSDSGSDAVGTHEAFDDSDSSGTGARGAVGDDDVREGADILPDRVVDLANGEGFPEADPDFSEMTDMDNDAAQALADADTSDDER
jgi:hypothetical protein